LSTTNDIKGLGGKARLFGRTRYKLDVQVFLARELLRGNDLFGRNIEADDGGPTSRKRPG
jgi:hypothetical protein